MASAKCERRKQIHTHLSIDEVALINKAAKIQGMRRSTFLRHWALVAARNAEPLQHQATDWLAKAREAVANG